MPQSKKPVLSNGNWSLPLFSHLGHMQTSFLVCSQAPLENSLRLGDSRLDFVVSAPINYHIALPIWTQKLATPTLSLLHHTDET
ncbi:unnamed protein product [Protopolystoma xenopodis]|uniref:Uncharacterized protein n=1 Tax=Protopolystoma xenopodis TaxID=117903 RepID=A0A448XEN8_9PLAT|nr:unnamed protein product [Protopolystoma xenopodis]